MKRLLLCVLTLWLISQQGWAQKQRIYSVDIFSNATTLPTHPGQLFNPIHPGVTLGKEFRYNKSDTNRIGQTIKLGYFHHSLVQNGIQLYSEFHYNYHLKNGLGFDALIGGGYIHSIPDHQIFKFNNGVYERKPNWGKPEVMGTFSIGAGYTFNEWKRDPRRTRVFINYQFWIQTPFVNSYVPVLPNTALHIGVARSFPHFSKYHGPFGPLPLTTPWY